MLSSIFLFSERLGVAQANISPAQVPISRLATVVFHIDADTITEDSFSLDVYQKLEDCFQGSSFSSPLSKCTCNLKSVINSGFHCIHLFRERLSNKTVRDNAKKYYG